MKDKFYSYYNTCVGLEMAAQLISRNKLEIQGMHCFQTETQTSPAGPLPFRADGPKSREDTGSWVCWCSQLLFDY